MGLYTAIPEAVEVAHTQSEDYDLEGDTVSARVTLLVPAAKRYAVVADVLGNAYQWPHGGGFNLAQASRCSIKPAPGSRGTTLGGDTAIVHDEYYVEVYYTVGDASKGKVTDGAGNVYSEELVTRTEFMTLDHQDFEWDTLNPLKENEAPSMMLRSFDYVRTMFNLLPPLPSGLLNLPGSCNASSFLSPTLGLLFPAETLLFGDPSISRTRTITGFTGITVRLSFAYKKDGWNKFWNPKTQTWQEIKKRSDGSVYKNHPPADFSAFLF